MTDKHTQRRDWA